MLFCIYAGVSGPSFPWVVVASLVAFIVTAFVYPTIGFETELDNETRRRIRERR
jgi:hypothetical protein